MKISLIHLSDIHLSEKTKHDQDVILNALYTDIKAQRDQGLQADALIWSGDLVSKGEYSDATQTWIVDEIFPKLRDSAKLSPDRVFIVPGNHDVQVHKIDKVLQPVIQGVATRSQANDLIQSAAANERTFLWAHLESFNALRARLHYAHTPLITNHLYQAFAFVKSGIRVGIGCINSAWKATGAPNDQDYGTLIIGERQIEDLANALSDCHVRIAVTHHPLEWLATSDKPYVQRALILGFDALLHGHNHSSDALMVAHASRGLFISNAGCLYQTREYFNGYSVLAYDTDARQWDVSVREYYDQRRAFDVCTRYAPNGRATLTAGAARDNTSIARLPTEQFLTAVNQRLDSLLLSNVSDVAPKRLNAIFVEPILSKASERKWATADSDSAPGTYTASQLINSAKPTLILGRREGGRTTVLAYFCVNATNPDLSPKLNHGFYVNVDSLRLPTRAALLESMVDFASGEIRRHEVIELLESGNATVCIDNVDLRDDKIVTLLSVFIKEFPRNKFVLAAHEDIDSSLGAAGIPSFGVEIDVAYLHAFTRKHTRQLIQKWFGESPISVRERADAALHLLQRLRIPRSPLCLTIFFMDSREGYFVHAS